MNPAIDQAAASRQTVRHLNCSRHIWARMRSILAKITSGRPFNACQISKDTGYCMKTILRDLQFLKAEGVEISYEPARKIWTLAPDAQIPQHLKGLTNRRTARQTRLITCHPSL